jgi:hypothetical protein
MFTPSRFLRSLSTAARIFRDEGPRGVRVTIERKLLAPLKDRDLKVILSHDSLRDRFTEIDQRKYWHSHINRESRSGDGSTRAFAEPYVKQLGAFLDGLRPKYGPKIVFFDAPCGDFNWIRTIATREDIRYIGGDIVPSIVAENNERYASPTVKFMEFDITTDRFPEATIWHCRDCLIHLSFSNILQSFKNFSSSTIDLALVTCHHLPADDSNVDISDGDFRRVDFRKPPFVLPPPIEAIPDSPSNEKIPRFTYVYTRDQIAGWLA